jgi:hypothetical protein
MKITTGAQKSILCELFFVANPRQSSQDPRPLVGREFPMEEFFDAASAKKKVMFKILDGKIIFEDREEEFTPSEVVILKKLWDEKKTWSSDLDPTVVGELKNIFYPAGK